MKLAALAVVALTVTVTPRPAGLEVGETWTPTVVVKPAAARVSLAVLRFDAACGRRTTVVSPIGLAVDVRRNVYVSERAGRVLRISPSRRRVVLVAPSAR